jgi:DUF971 family protein
MSTPQPTDIKLRTASRLLEVRFDDGSLFALRLHFDDGHNTGLYSWAVLHRLGREHGANWARYQERCAEAAEPHKTQP